MSIFLDMTLKITPKQFQKLHWNLCDLLLEFRQIDNAIVKLIKPHVILLEFDEHCFYLKNINGAYWWNSDEDVSSFFIENNIKQNEINELLSKMQDVIKEYAQHNNVLCQQFLYNRKEIMDYKARYYG